MDRLETVVLFVEYLYDCRLDGRFDTLEALLELWRRDARPEDFGRLGEQLVRIAEHRRTATVIRLADRVRLRDTS